MRAITKFHNLRIVLFACLLFLCLYIFVVQNILFYIECDNRNENFTNSFETKSTESSNHLYKRVTKSLSDIKRLTTLNEHVLMFNHGSKSGSEMFILILKWLQGSNNFRHFRLCKGQSGRLSSKHQKQTSEFVSKIIRDLATPVSLDSCTYFINFTQYGWDSPTHFGIIRDPGEILKASANLEPTSDPELLISNIPIVSSDLNIPNFCGHHTNCTDLNSEWALHKAKENVEKFYSTVGVIEYIEETLYVLEKKLKYFFKGAVDIYLKKFQEKHISWKKKLDKNEHVLKEIKQILRTEYDFYNWIKSRLFDQLIYYQRQDYEDMRMKIKKIPNLNFQIEEP